jgi:hypothetical protein
MGRRTIVSKAFPAGLTVKPRGKISSSGPRPRVSLMKLSRHSAQKSRLESALSHVGYVQLLTILLLLLLSQSVLGLGDFEFAFTEQSDKTDSKIGSSEIEGEVLANFCSFGVLPSAVSGRRTYAKDECGDWGQQSHVRFDTVHSLIG